METKETLEKQLTELYAQIGKVFYGDHRGDAHLVPKYSEIFAQVKPIYEKLIDMENEELERQGLKRCPACGKTIPIDSIFCNMCGHRLVMPQEENNDLEF